MWVAALVTTMTTMTRVIVTTIVGLTMIARTEMTVMPRHQPDRSAAWVMETRLVRVGRDRSISNIPVWV